MKQVSCDVTTELPRVDLVVGEGQAAILYRGATLQGAGGIMGGSDAAGWTEIAKRHRVMAAKGDMLRIYSTYRPQRVEAIDTPARETRLVAVYAPGYEAANNWRRE